MQDAYVGMFMREVGIRKQRLRNDSLFRMEMSVCQEYRIPHSEFMDWPFEDQVKAVALMILKAEECTLCGTHPQDWEENEDAFVAESKWCPGCYRTDAARDPDAMAGTTTHMVRNTEERQLQIALRTMEQIRLERENRNNG